MKKYAAAAAAVLFLTLLGTAQSFAQGCPGYQWQGSGGWGMGGQYNRMWDQSKVETVKGRVEAIETLAPMRGMHNAVVVVLKTPKESLQVHLGPQWYIERLDVQIQKGDTIEVKGSRTSFDGKPALIAGEVRKGNETLTLRNESGVPAWAGWRRKW